MTDENFQGVDLSVSLSIKLDAVVINLNSISIVLRKPGGVKHSTFTSYRVLEARIVGYFGRRRGRKAAASIVRPSGAPIPEYPNAV